MVGGNLMCWTINVTAPMYDYYLGIEMQVMDLLEASIHQSKLRRGEKAKRRTYV